MIISFAVINSLLVFGVVLYIMSLITKKRFCRLIAITSIVLGLWLLISKFLTGM